MTTDKGVATSWLEGLASRGVTVTVRNNRLWLHPASAYKSLTDAEVLVLRHHRAEIKALVKVGISLDVVRTGITVENVTPEPATTCKWCGRAPCIGVEHDAFLSLHPIEAKKRADEFATKTLLKMTGQPLPDWWFR